MNCLDCMNSTNLGNVSSRRTGELETNLMTRRMRERILSSRASSARMTARGSKTRLRPVSGSLACRLSKRAREQDRDRHQPPGRQVRVGEEREQRERNQESRREAPVVANDEVPPEGRVGCVNSAAPPLQGVLVLGGWVSKRGLGRLVVSRACRCGAYRPRMPGTPAATGRAKVDALSAAARRPRG